MKKTILIIESDDVKFYLLRNYLSDLNYQADAIRRCISSDESLSVPPDDFLVILAHLRGSSFDYLPSLLDLQNHFTNIPVIILSDQENGDACTRAIRSGAQDFLAFGNFDSDQLGKSISCAINRQSVLIKNMNAVAEYQRHFNNGPMPMWIIDGKNMKFLVVNNATIKKYGYSREEFATMSARDIRPQEDVQAIEKFFSQKKDGYYDAGYWRHKKKDGEIFYVHVYSHVITYNGIDARLSIIVDVNEKVIADKQNKELMAMLTEQKEQLDNILFSISDAIWSRRADTLELTYANNAYYKLFEIAPGTLITDKKRVFDSIHPDDKFTLLRAISEVQEQGKTDLVYRYIHHDGSTKILKVSATLKKGSNGKPDMINGVTIDITSETEMYNTIRNNEQKLRATIENTNDLIWSVNRKLEIIFCNKAYQEFFYKLAGIEIDEGDYVLGDWHDESFINKRKEDYERAFNGESFSTIVEEDFNGSTIYFEISANPITDHHGNIIGVNCISRDITEKRKQLIKIRRQNEMLKEIAWIQSHKVRGPLASILGLVSLFDTNEITGEHNTEILEKLRTAAADLDNVIKEVVQRAMT